MTKYSKESLEKLLVLVGDICKDEDNFWFKEKLKTITTAEGSEENHFLFIRNIEKYLKIDGVVVIDYSDITNEVVRQQLYRDCIEMSKYRLGKINDTINFDEYCRYAHMQAEELINYFYNEKFYGNLDYIQEFVAKYFTIYKPIKDIYSLNQITYYAKASAFFKAYDLEKGALKPTIEFLNSLRNELSHRNSVEVQNEDLILADAQLKKIDVTSSYFDYGRAKEERETFKAARFIYQKRRQDYEQVIESLDYLKQAIVLLLKS